MERHKIHVPNHQPDIETRWKIGIPLAMTRDLQRHMRHRPARVPQAQPTVVEVWH